MLPWGALAALALLAGCPGTAAGPPAQDAGIADAGIADGGANHQVGLGPNAQP